MPGLKVNPDSWTHSQRHAQQPLSFRLNELSCLLRSSKHLGGMGPRLIQEPAEHPCRAALVASPLQSHPWPAAACQACWPIIAEPQPPASSAVWLEHPANAAMSSCAGRRQPVGVGSWGRGAQPALQEPHWLCLGGSPSSWARERPSRAGSAAEQLVPS